MNAFRLLIPLCICVATSSAAVRPNIVFLMADDQSSDSLGCYGNPDVITPHIDKLSEGGLTFNHHYNPTSICMASRASVMTGLYEYRHGCNFEHGDLQERFWKQSYPMLLRQVGYQTAFAGKFGFDIKDADGKRLPLPEADFDRWGGGPGQTHYETRKNASIKSYAEEFPHSTRAYGAFGRDFIAAAAKDEGPFCLSISFKAPHKPATPDPKFDKVYAGKSFRKPANYGREKGLHFSKQSRQGRQYERFTSWGYANDFDKVMATYHQQIHAIDVAVGMIREALEKAGVAENTVIIYTSDNGFLCGSHGYGSKVLPYEESSRVPLIIHDPRQPADKAGVRTQSLTGGIDLMPTILQLAGLPLPKKIDGRSLLPLLTNPDQSVRDSLQLINVWGPAEAHCLAVVSKNSKYIHWPFAGEGFEPSDELYDLSKDSLELKNRAHDPEYKEQLKAAQRSYDQAVKSWNADAVPFNNYRPYATIFDRSLPWSDKSPLLKVRGRAKQ